MVDEPIVQMAKEPGIRGQFGKGRFSYQNSSKVSGPVVAGSCALLVVAVSAVVLGGSPKKDKSDLTSRFLAVQVPQTALSVGELSIPHADSKPSPNPSAPVVHAGNGIKLSGPELVSRPRNVTIPPGSMVAAVLLSGASDGPVKVELKEPLTVAGETLLEVGTVLFGVGHSGEDRLMIQFQKAVFSDGSVAKVDAQAVDQSDKIAGLKGSRVGGRAIKLLAGVGLNFVGGMSQGLQDTQGQFGAVVAPPSAKNALLNGATRASIEESQSMMNEYRNQKQVIEVGAGTILYVLFSDSSG